MKIIVLPGDGIGPEIVESATQVLQSACKKNGIELTLDYEDVGFVSLKKHGITLRNEILEVSKNYDGIILGTQSHMDYPPLEKGGRNISAAFRIGLDLYANVRPARTRSYLGRGTPGMDLVIMREATEGFYPDRNMSVGWGEMMPTPDMALSIRKITAHCSERIARRAFELAMRRKKHVTAIHKVNSFKLTDGLFLEQVRKVSEEFPEVVLDDVLIDAMTAHLVRDPSRFDVIVATNFYGDILSDLASELAGSIGLAGSYMASDTHCCAQAQHGSAPDIAGQDKANPSSMILSTAMLLQWIGENQKSEIIKSTGVQMEEAIDKVLRDPQKRTTDLGGNAKCSEFSKYVSEVFN